MKNFAKSIGRVLRRHSKSQPAYKSNLLKTLALLLGFGLMPVMAQAQQILLNSLDATHLEPRPMFRGEQFLRGFTPTQNATITEVVIGLNGLENPPENIAQIEVRLNGMPLDFVSFDSEARRVTYGANLPVLNGVIVSFSVNTPDIEGFTQVNLQTTEGVVSGWQYKAQTSWQDYKTGHIAGVNLSASWRF